MALREAFIRFREALRLKRRREVDFTDTRTPIVHKTPRGPRRYRGRWYGNNRKLTKARRAARNGVPLPHQIAFTKAERKRELWDQYFAARETRRMAQRMANGSPTAIQRQLGVRQYQDAERRMKQLVQQIVRV